MNDQQSEQAISLYQDGHGYKAIAKKMGFKSATSIKRVITRAGLNDKSRACVAPKTAGRYQTHSKQGVTTPAEQPDSEQKDYSKDAILLAEAQLFAQRQTAKMFSFLSQNGIVLTYMPLMNIEKVDTQEWCLREDVEFGKITEQEAERLESIALSESGLFEVCVRDTSGYDMDNFGYFERQQVINLVTGRLPFDEMRGKAIKRALMNAFIYDTVKYAPERCFTFWEEQREKFTQVKEG